MNARLVLVEERQRQVGSYCGGLLFGLRPRLLKLQHELTALLVVEIQLIDAALRSTHDEGSVAFGIALQILQHIVVNVLKNNGIEERIA